MNSNSTQKRIAFGYNRCTVNKIELHTGQASTVKLIFQMYDEGSSLSRIADVLSSAGIPSPQNKPKWGRQALSNILSNVHYTGDSDYPQIIDNTQFIRVQQLKAAWPK
jgi:hypothetical protein